MRLEVQQFLAPGRYDEELSLSINSPKVARLTIPVHLFVKNDI